MSLDPRDPSVRVDLTPDAERITARVDGWMREVRDRAERGQLKYPPWHTATTPRNAGREGVEEALDLLWYLSAAQDQIAHLTARIADLERERDGFLKERMIAMKAAEYLARRVASNIRPTDDENGAEIRKDAAARLLDGAVAAAAIYFDTRLTQEARNG